MRAWLVLVATLPLLAVGSGAGAGTAPVTHENGLIAVRGTDGIYVVQANGSAPRLLPSTNEATGEPAWSPDGSLLAVTAWDAAVADGSAVYTMKPDGSQRRLVIGNAWAPSWTPDGERLLVVRDTGGGSPVLASVAVDGSDVQELTVHGKAVRDVVEGEWSPDGNWLALATVTGVQLVSDEADVARSLSKSGYNLSWSPDSSKLAFDRYVEKPDAVEQVVVIVDVQTGKETILRGRERGATGAAWSPDGKQLAFLSVSPDVVDTGGGCGGHQDAHLWVAAPDGTNPHQLAKGVFTAPPSWAPAQEPAASDATPATPAPADKAPATISDKPQAPEPKPAPAPTRDTKPAPKVVKGFPAAADGRIAARGADGIYLVSAQRGGAHLVPGTAKMDHPAWSPGGRLLAVDQADGYGTSVYTMRPNGSDVRLVLKNASAPAWSADGTRIFATHGAAADEADILLSVGADGTDARQVTEEEFYEETGWPADGAYLGFFTDDQVEGLGLSLDSSAAAWSPDGRWLAFAAGSPTDDIVPGLWAVDANGADLHLLARGSFGALSWGAAPRD